MEFTFRPQRGGLTESLSEARRFRTRDALAHYLDVAPCRLDVKPYAYDDRIGWDTHLVTLDGEAVGFTDGPA